MNYEDCMLLLIVSSTGVFPHGFSRLANKQFNLASSSHTCTKLSAKTAETTQDIENLDISSLTICTGLPVALARTAPVQSRFLGLNMSGLALLLVFFLMGSWLPYHVSTFGMVHPYTKRNGTDESTRGSA